MATEETYDQRKAELLDEARGAVRGMPDDDPGDSEPPVDDEPIKSSIQSGNVANVTTEVTRSEVAKKETVYLVMHSSTEKGPWTLFGEYSGHGQVAAKKQAAAALGEKATNLYFIAVPKTSFVPERPTVKTVTEIVF
jgi:hypothetical protein